ncbi:MAG: glycosyltransferase family 4 protein [Sedimentisphaerales bacterium]|nr:glycosyltransferase family 4 protein [Sedimentisphaerales bacterium]
MRVFMLGWEFPPFISGGLGTACYGLTKAMDKLGIKVTFVLPRAVQGEHSTHVKMLSSESHRPITGFMDSNLPNTKFLTVDAALYPYSDEHQYRYQIEHDLAAGNSFTQARQNLPMANAGHYAGDMYSEVHRYAAIAAELALNEDFDVVHAHDWMTYPAGIAVASRTGKPLIVHIHSTEFDRSGEHVNQMIYDFERQGFHAADRVIAVSHYTRNILISRYGVCGDKIEVVHNGVDRSNGSNGDSSLSEAGIERDEKLVLFLGRITMQKGPEYFLQAAKRVLEVMEDVKFVMAGAGDMMHRAINMAAELGIGRKVLFTGFLQGEQVRKIYQMADLYVMPSVSEPFGIAPLEALNHEVPVIISKQSGVSEVLTHALKVDFWDIDEMANKIIAVLRHQPLQVTLRDYGNYEVRKLRWEDSAAKCARIYNETLVAV